MSPDPTSELAALLNRAGIFSLDETGWIRVTGADRVRWLNGMVTNSIQDLAPGEGCYNFVLNAQGRIQGVLTAFLEDDALLLKTDRNRVPELIALLDRFIIMDEVELADVTAECAGLGIAGPAAAQMLESIGLTTQGLSPMHKRAIPAQESAVTLLHEFSPLVPRFEIWTAPAALPSLSGALRQSGATLVSHQSLELLRILQGTPRYGVDIRNTETARDLPQETGQTRALHFNKGCYLGQEIVERIRSRGQVHRVFSGLLLTGELPAPGTQLDAGGKPAGEITSAALIPHPTAGRVQIGLGYIRREALEAKALLAYPGGSATAIALPYRPE